MKHIVLAGDSIFDNTRYVDSGQSVIDQLRRKANNNFDSTLIAVDGSITNELNNQFVQLPPDTTHLFISSGGNDALEAERILGEPVANVFGAMTLLSKAIDQFHADYRAMLHEAVDRVQNVIVCTIYDSIPGYAKEAMTALKLFNEVILREAFANNLPVIDLRLICDDANDYSIISPIEPSEQGGDKIADSIVYLTK
ncbi:MAG: SGNH/GDSL hydrolase family protein [Gammaproteobacteria bacterium]|nr:SGNH/GDSL hydrolase family protein [Gammaproteobacteria bacterium]